MKQEMDTKLYSSYVTSVCIQSTVLRRLYNNRVALCVTIQWNGRTIACKRAMYIIYN